MASSGASNTNFNFPRPMLSSPPLTYSPPEQYPNNHLHNEVGTWIFILLIVLLLLALIEATIDKCITNIHIQTEEIDHDLENGELEGTSFLVSHLNHFVDHPWIMEVMEYSIRELMEKRRKERLRIIAELLPLVNYKELEPESNFDECVICLEDFQDGESCRLFPVCNHIFHSDCICSWLESNLTCPICRNRCDLSLSTLY
ncbi:hypothetical protein ACFE04_022447 [Oxalis oulophora]